jgi:hypothetical protein
VFGVNVLSNIFDGDADSSVGTYLTIGGVPSILGVVAIYAGLSVLRSGRI